LVRGARDDLPPALVPSSPLDPTITSAIGRATRPESAPSPTAPISALASI
jgi:hypothetical protein